MTFQPIHQERAAEAVVDQIEKLILRGILRPNERLPSERGLAEELGVSRPTLREAVVVLQEKGLLVSKAGSGLFVADFVGTAFAAPLIELFATQEEAVQDYLAFRIDLEALAAERAAKLGSELDLEAIEAIFNKMEVAHREEDVAYEAELDAQFHMAIIEASHNVFFLHMARSMFELLKRGVFYNRQLMFQRRATRDNLLEQHRAITLAILARDPDRARKAIVTHLEFKLECLDDAKKAEENERTAELRKAHRTRS